MSKIYQRIGLSSIFLIALLFHSRAQAVTGVEVNIVGDNLQVTYAMSGLSMGQKFDVELYSSIDNYSSPLADEMIVGDLGKDIPLKSSNLITIGDPLETLGAITGDLNFKIKTTLIYNPVSVTLPATFFKQKRKKKFNTVWTGGLSGELVNFDLYRDNQLILDDFHTTVNTRSTEFKFPKQATGPGYTMMMQFESLNQDVVLPDFEVKRKKSIFKRFFNLTLLALAVDFTLYGLSNEVQPFGNAEDTPGVRTEDYMSFFFGKYYDPLGMTNNDLPAPPEVPFAIAPITIFSF
jgi:hypothetical protein